MVNSVERIKEYLDLPSEPPAVIQSSRPPAAWPPATKGTLVVENLVLKYSPELEPMLNGYRFPQRFVHWRIPYSITEEVFLAY
jgi:hypothetical protein